MKNNLIKYGLFSLLITSFPTLALSGTDISKGKTAAATCAGCHGMDGIGLSSEFPNLAGQKKSYLIKQLKAFKSGDRKNPTMKAMTASLSHSDITHLAAYFSSLSSKSNNPSQSSSARTSSPTNTEFPSPVYISMKKSASVELFPQQDIWKGGPNMLYVAVTPDGKKVLSTSPSTNTVYVFNAKTGQQLAVIPVGKAPKGVKVSPDGRVAYISNQGSAEVSVIDIKRLKVIDTIKVADGPHNARFTRDGKTAYVTLQGGAGIAVIDTTKRKMIKIIPVPGITGPHNLDLSADEKTAYVRDFVHHVAILDLRSGAVKKVIKVGNGHGGIDASPGGNIIATAAIGDDFISVIDKDTLQVKNINVGNGPHGIRTSEDGRWIYVTITKENIVTIVDTQTMKVHKKIATGKFPFWVAVPNNP